MHFEMHLEKVDPDYRWNLVHAIDGGVLARFVSYRDDRTFVWFSGPRGGGVRIAPAYASPMTRAEDFARLAQSPVLEIRQYRVAPGQRERFARFFVERCVHSLVEYGMAVYGWFDDLDDANNFVWFRGFPNLLERDRRKAAFYQSRLWLEELQDEAFSMIEDYTNVLLVAPVMND